MPQNQSPGDRNALRYLTSRLDKVESEVARLKSSQGKPYLDRGDHEAIPNPSEGQVMVNYLTDRPYYYAREAWRPFGADIPWIACYDNLPYGQTINTSASENLEYPYIDWSDNAGGIFTYVRSASTLGASNNYNPKLLVDGLYLFSWDEISENVGSGEYAVDFHLPIGNYPGGTADNRWKRYNNAAIWSSTYFYEMGSIMLPVDVGTGITVYPWIEVIPKTGASNFNVTFRNKLWIAYLGPLNNSATFNSSHHNDPYPTTP